MIDQVIRARGVDCSRGRPDPAVIRRAGYRFVGRYIGLGGADKRLTPTEVAGLDDAGLPWLAYCEGGAGWMLGGRAAGERAYAACRHDALTLEEPWPQPVYLAADVDIAPDEVGYIWACLAGYSKLAGHANTGLYGPGAFVEDTLAQGRVAYGAVASGWRHGWVHQRAQVVQRLQISLGGVLVDPLDAYHHDIGLWGSRPVPPKRKERDMLIIAREGDYNTFKTNGFVRAPVAGNDEIAALRELGYEYRVVDEATWTQLVKLPTYVHSSPLGTPTTGQSAQSD